MDLTTALKVVDQVDKFVGAEGQEFPSDKSVLEALFKLRDTLIATGVISVDDKGTLTATPVADRASRVTKELPSDQVAIAARQRALPLHVQMAITATLQECGKFMKPVLVGRPPKDAHDVFNGLLEALVSMAEIGVTGRRDPRIVVPGESLN